jgi:hypothetical protein
VPFTFHRNFAQPAAIAAAALLWVASFALNASAATGESESEVAAVAIDISSPTAGEIVRNRVHVAAIRGIARSGVQDPLDFDVMIAIDVSKSTRFPSGIDVDEDGDVGFNPHEELIAPGTYHEDVVCSDPDDSILSAEIQAARMLIDSLTAGRSRVGVLTFSGEVDLETGERASPNQKSSTRFTAKVHTVRPTLRRRFASRWLSWLGSPEARARLDRARDACCNS